MFTNHTKGISSAEAPCHDVVIIISNNQMNYQPSLNGDHNYPQA